jgi:type VI secretion system protein ImpL
MRAIIFAVRTVAGIAGLCAALLLSVAVWLFAPALLDIGAWWVLLLVAAVPVLVWMGFIVWAARMAQRRDTALVEGATQVDERAANARAAADATKDEEAAVAARLAEAMRALKSAGSQGAGKGGYLYERPWYVLIGPPGSGKTTAIRSSGL